MKMTSNWKRPVESFVNASSSDVERRHPDAHALLLAEGLDDLRVEVVGVVVDLQLAAALGVAGLDRVADLAAA